MVLELHYGLFDSVWLCSLLLLLLLLRYIIIMPKHKWHVMLYVEVREKRSQAVGPPMQAHVGWCQDLNQWKCSCLAGVQPGQTGYDTSVAVNSRSDFEIIILKSKKKKERHGVLLNEAVWRPSFIFFFFIFLSMCLKQPINLTLMWAVCFFRRQLSVQNWNELSHYSLRVYPNGVTWCNAARPHYCFCL